MNFNFSAGIRLNSPASIYFSLSLLTIHPVCLCLFHWAPSVPRVLCGGSRQLGGYSFQLRATCLKGSQHLHHHTASCTAEGKDFYNTPKGYLAPTVTTCTHNETSSESRRERRDEQPSLSPGLAVIFSWKSQLCLQMALTSLSCVPKGIV